jgi:mRNA-degrading endonuclease YafQ of YafQ-DinJ toxin-antitoxin module
MKKPKKTYEIEYTEQFLKDVQTHKKSGKEVVWNKINNLILIYYAVGKD